MAGELHAARIRQPAPARQLALESNAGFLGRAAWLCREQVVGADRSAPPPGIAGRFTSSCVKWHCGSTPRRRHELVRLDGIFAVSPPRSLRVRPTNPVLIDRLPLRRFCLNPTRLPVAASPRGVVTLVGWHPGRPR